MAKKNKKVRAVKQTLPLKLLVAALLIVILVIFLMNSWRKQTIHEPITMLPVQVGTIFFQVEIADEPSEYTHGLADRDRLLPNSGMLFLLPGRYRPVFWMKGMKFPLDILWIRDNHVIDMQSEVPVAKTAQLPTYSPKEEVDMVLEIPSGTIKNSAIHIGDGLNYDRQTLLEVEKNTRSQ